MKRLASVGAILAVFCVAASLNVIAASSPNYKCFNGPCMAVSKLCAGTGICSWCNSATQLLLCGVKIGQVCAGTGANFNCGNKYTGVCVNGVCTGTSWAGLTCKQPQCQFGSIDPQ